MSSYLVLLRGINVGGRNKVPMAELRKLLEDLGFENVSTYITAATSMGRSAGTPVYPKLTIRSWQTTLALLELMGKR